jgi:DNA (cytosine-5)-methyltransferase 1
MMMAVLFRISFVFSYCNCFLYANDTMFVLIGGKCIWACEIDRKAAMTYNANFDSPPYHDIRRADLTLFPPFDIAVAGFPCQDFSGLGEQRGLEGSKGALFYEVIRVLEHCRPPMILLENVKGLQSMQEGGVLAVVTGELERLGYTVTTQVMNASCLVPQYRPRLYICGFLDPDASRLHRFPPPPQMSPPRVVGDCLHTPAEEPFLDMYKLSKTQWQTVRKAKTSRKYGLQKRLVAPQDRVVDTLIRSYRESRQSIAQFVAMGDRDEMVAEDEEEQQQEKKEEKEKSALKSSSSAPEDHYNSHVNSGSVTLKNEVSRPRWFTPRECARLMGFPESFLLPPGGLPAYEQLGNAVVPPVITLLVSELFAASAMAQGASAASEEWRQKGLRVACGQVLASLPATRAQEMCESTSVSHPLFPQGKKLLKDIASSHAGKCSTC